MKRANRYCSSIQRQTARRAAAEMRAARFPRRPRVAGIIVHSPWGYDRLNLELAGDEREIALIAPIFGHLVKQYDYVICDLPNEVSASVFACLVQSDQSSLSPSTTTNIFIERDCCWRISARHTAAREPKVRVILTAGGRDRRALRRGSRTQGRATNFTSVAMDSLNRSGRGGGRHAYVIRQPMAAYSLVVRRIARELGKRAGGVGAGHGRGARVGAHRRHSHPGTRGIAIDVVAGSSMGSLIAAAWRGQKRRRNGRNRQADPRQTRVSEIARPDVSRRGDSARHQGLQLSAFDRERLTFADTPIPLKIVASDLNTLEEVVFEDGKLIDAIRASISIPGVFRPVINDGHTLIDGGITDPVPVQVLAHAGVSKIIAVNTIPMSTR